MTARRHHLVGRVAAAFVLVAIGLLLPTFARAATRIYSFSAVPSSAQAGGHPDVAFSFTLGNRQLGGVTDPCGCTEDAKVTAVHLPTGLIGNPGAVPRCSADQFASDQCPVDSQLGFIEVGLNTGPGTGFGSGVVAIAPVFNLIPPPTEPALLGFKVGLVNSPVFEVVSARTGGDYGVDTTVSNIDHVVPLARIKQVIWGVPADPAHNPLRFEFSEGIPTAILTETEHVLTCDANDVTSTADPTTAVHLCSDNNSNPGNSVGLRGPVASNSPRVPFFQNPTTCGLTSLETSLDVLSYDGGESHATSTWPATTNCAQLAFNPSLFARPTTESTDSPSGIDVDLKAPSFESPEAPSPSEIRGTMVTLPPGFTINPNAADGKTACLDAEALFGTTEEAHCPEFSKIGTLEVHSPVLPGALPGAIYIGHPEAGNRYRLFLTFDGFGVHVKLAGSVHPDPQTGQVVTEFKNLPQFPFEDFDLHFFGSERGILATPTQCGTYPVSTVFEPWDGALPNQTSTQFFTLNSGPGGSACPNGPRPFSPRFAAASANNTAGSHTAFSLNLTRQDGDQNLSALNVTTPPGFSATLKGIPYCPEAAIAAAASSTYSGAQEQAHPSCPAASLLGEAFAGVGAGTHPFYAPGKVYLAGPYKGAPLSMVVITPAVSGPYDLGDVVVRVALHVDPTTAQVSAISDPLPQILEGIPLRLRSIMVNLNRPGFSLNPTNCSPFSTQATVFGSEGATASLASHFQVANCARLDFAPKLAISVKGPTKRAQDPALKAVLTMPPGNANIARAQVTLPHSNILEQAHIGTVCTRVQFAAHACPPTSIYGRAVAYTPLLDQPLSGSVYLRSSSNKLPDLVADLNGQLEVTLDGKVDTGKGEGIRNTFSVVPDAPVSKFVLSLRGGKKGLLVNSENLCGPHAKVHAIADFTGQNGKVHNTTLKVQNDCSKKQGKAHKRPGAGR
jgi:hypothetical protein